MIRHYPNSPVDSVDNVDRLRKLMQFQWFDCPHYRLISVHTESTVDSALSGLWTAQKLIFL